MSIYLLLDITLTLFNARKKMRFSEMRIKLPLFVKTVSQLSANQIAGIGEKKSLKLIFTGNANQRAGSNALIHDVNIKMHLSFVTFSYS